ncbi:MAG TPA: ABC transporter permease [Chitinophagaceae bacterium]
MFKNYFKTAWRNLSKNKISSFINISGLAIGMAAAILIGLWIYDELSFNKNHENYNSIAKVMVTQNENGEINTSAGMPIPLSNELRTSFKDDFKYVVMSTFSGEHILSAGNKMFTETGNYMEPDATDMLTLKMVYGTRAALKNINSILIAHSLAKKLFGNADPVNKMMKIDNKLNVKVTGVYADLPQNSEFKDVLFIAPWNLFLSSEDWFKDQQDDWSSSFFPIYTQVTSNTDFNKVSAKIKNVELNHADKEEAAAKPTLFLYPMSKWHLYSQFENGKIVTSEQMKFVWFYSIIGAFVLLLACINFMNLNTARSEKRSKEVGIRKSIGSLRSQLISQFLSESLLTVIIAFILSLILVQLSLSWFNKIAEKDIRILWTSPAFWFTAIIFIIITGLVAGSYPAFYLSSFKPVKVLKGSFQLGRFAFLPRKLLVGFQFVISISLIIGTITMYRQIQFSKNRPVGYTQNGLLYLKVNPDEFHNHYDAMRNDLLKSGAITEMAESNMPVTKIYIQNTDFKWKGKDPNQQANFGFIPVSYDFGKTIGWRIKDGRDFSREFSTDSAGVIINEAAAKFMHLKNPVGETIQRNDKNYTILGVVEDMVMQSPYNPAVPTIFSMLKSGGGIVSIKVSPNANMSDALNKIKAVFKAYVPDMPFEYKFVDDEYAQKFAAEIRISKLTGCFAAFAIFISCLGLFGMAIFIAEKRTKEIGVRKVLGASVFNLWNLLSKEFMLLMIISFVIATPLSYYFMHNWLQNYQYRTELSWWIFAAAGVGAMMITLLTVSFQSVKAAIANPVKSLRTE